SSPANSIAQPTSSGTPLDTCVDSGSGGACAWQLSARTGTQLHLATIVDGNAHGTTDPADDTYTLIGYAIGQPVTLTANQTLTGESLTMVPAGALTTLKVSFPSSAAGLGHATAIPMLDLGVDGKLVFPLPTVAPGATTATVLAPTGSYANGI